MSDPNVQLKELQEAGQYIKEMVRDLAEIQKHTLTNTVQTGAPAHGVGGLFSSIGVRPDMYHTLPRPINQWMDMIPLIKSNLNNEIWEVLTGQTAMEGNAAADACSPGPVPGQFKTCQQVIPFGTGKMDTRVKRITGIGRRNDYADIDRNILNWNVTFGKFVPQITGINPNSDAGKAFAELGLAIESAVNLCDGQGVAGATSNVGHWAFWMTQFGSFPRYVRTGYTDAITGVACPAADSVVFTHGANINAAGINGRTFVQNVVDMIYSVKERASTFGMTPFLGVIVINPKLERALYENWACAYYTDFCAGGQYHENNTDAVMITKFRDEMMANHYLLVDGQPIPVVTHSDLLVEATGTPNEYFADLFYMPIAWGGRALSYYQYFPMNNADALQWFGETDPNGIRFYNNGLYAAAGSRAEFCSSMAFMMQMRFILDTPWLAGRVDDIEFMYLAQTRDARPGMSFYQDGGQSGRLIRVPSYGQR